MGSFPRLALALPAAASAAAWALGVTVFQPLSEPSGPGALGENNTYWARELRWAALLAAAIVAAVAAGLVTMTESPTDVEPRLQLGSALAGSLLALIAVGFSWRALPIAVLLGAAPWALRYTSPEPAMGRVIGVFALTVLLVVAVVGLAGRGSPVAVAAITAFALPVMLLPLVVLASVLQMGATFTVLAANPPVNDADSDLVLVLLAVPIGLALDRLLRACLQHRPAWSRNVPS
ncbi:hypothetical protein Ade02nite_17390 [Paractinoplanes deccanensis]|uniref:EccD-like transmembrane domain-containing protein n=1 Tax=Paractinoplanes deccanensis TaxID=113561 RepID=A0ABQ3XZD6_9ACTN|nr:hypothetical protein [Actinoplanes deccanensis]GID73098.1 hypothetical protein Ade02nite_17390 [Actinoplanes deccanensis]